MALALCNCRSTLFRLKQAVVLCNRNLNSQTSKFEGYQKSTVTSPLIFNISKQYKSNLRKLCAGGRKFHTSEPRKIVPPVLWVFIKPLAKVATIISGRIFRKHYRGLSPENRAKFKEKYQKFIGMGIVGLCTALIVNYNYHQKETPITHRRRYVPFTNKQLEKVVTVEAENILEKVKDSILPPNHPSYQYVMRIISRIMEANQDLDFFREQNWTVVVLKSEEANAFVLPTGHVFVFTGLFKIAETEDQVAVVLGHEMAHALLQHGAEKLAFTQFLDYVVIFVMAAIWAVVPYDGVALITQWFYNKVVKLLVSLPYSRKLETEADDVGLALIAKACYDVRESSNFWTKMLVKTKLEALNNEDHIVLPEFLSSHPNDDSRAVRLNQIMPVANKLREAGHCRPLPDRDPRCESLALLDMLQDYIANQQNEVEKTSQ